MLIHKGLRPCLQRAAIRSITTHTRSTLKIALLPADGTGKEVIPAARAALEALGSDLPKLEFINLLAGFELFTRVGTALHGDTIEALREQDCALLGTISEPSERAAGYSSPLLTLRKQLDLYANIRPILSVSKDPAKKPDVDLVVVREITECLYIQQEVSEIGEHGRTAKATRLITERASTKIGKIACETALQRPRKRVTIIHKSGVFFVTDGLFREAVRRVPSLPEVNGKYDSIQIEDQVVDIASYRLFREPHIFDVMVTPNLYGDILSDSAAALVGSLGLVPAVNVGDTFVMGELVHGSAPDAAGKSIANPLASIRSAALMLRHLGYGKQAGRIENAVDAVIRDGSVLTPDLGGRSKTEEVTAEVLKRI